MGQQSANGISASGRLLPALGWGLFLMLLAGSGAGLIRWLNAAWAGQEERVLGVAALAALLGAVLPASVYLGSRRSAAVPRRAGLLVLAGTGMALAAFYLAWVSHYVEFPADILIWSEGDFVNDIVKFQIGYPLYTAPVNNDSFHYTPGAQLLTYALAWVCGAPNSIPLYRGIQVGYCLTAALVALCCYQRLVLLAGTARKGIDRGLWGAVGLPFFFLVATNSVTNGFAHNLHNDALAQLIAVLAYWLLLDYAWRRSRVTQALMALVPALGFLVKQNLAIWIPLYGTYLLFFDAPRSVPRAIGFVGVALAGLALLLAGCSGVWGEPFWYWTVSEMAGHYVSPLRAFQHLLAGWMYYAIGLAAGLVFLRGAAARRLLGPWVIWLLFLLAQTYTSGIEWMVNHLGSGCLLASIWFLAALTRLWSADRLLDRGRAWTATALGVVLVGLAYAGLGLVWMPVKSLPADAYRYVAEIEREFAGLPADKVLLDVGDWIRARQGIVMKDAAPGIGSRGSSRAGGDFSGFLERLAKRHYAKILVRNPAAPGFWYDNQTGWWPQSSGIRQAMRANYQEVGRIRAVEGEKRFLLFSFEPVPWSATRYGFQEIAILVPRAPRQ